MFYKGLRTAGVDNGRGYGLPRRRRYGTQLGMAKKISIFLYRYFTLDIFTISIIIDGYRYFFIHDKKNRFFKRSTYLLIEYCGGGPPQEVINYKT